jgi:hypothetical protein
MTTDGTREVWNWRTERLETRLNIAVPSEPRRTKRPAVNPYAHRSTLGPTSQYRADKVAAESLRVDYYGGPVPHSYEWALQTVLEWLDPSERLARLSRYQ